MSDTHLIPMAKTLSTLMKSHNGLVASARAIGHTKAVAHLETEAVELVGKAAAVIDELLDELNAVYARIDATKQEVMREAQSNIEKLRDAPVATERVYEMRGFLLSMLSNIRGDNQ